MRRLFLLGAAILALLLVPLALADVNNPQVVVMNPGDYYDPVMCNGVQLTNGLYLCNAPAATPTTVPATQTPIPTSTSTPAPNATPTVTATDDNGVPFCTDHDPQIYHSLVKRNPDNSINCTYGHTHGDDPSSVDNIFGPLSNYLTDSISYPWETSNPTTGVLENVAKHRVYKWEVVQNQPCVGSRNFDAGRLEVHSDGNGGATTEFHSFWAQLRTCDASDPSYHGTISVGGWLDYGYLDVDGNYVPLPGQPDPSQTNNERIHGSPQYPRYDFTWYGRQQPPVGTRDPNAVYADFFTGIRENDWGPVDPKNPTGPVLFYGGNHYGGSQIEPWHIVEFNAGPWLPGDVNGVINYDGYTDRYGAIVQGCTRPALNCVPFSLHNVKEGDYQFRNDTGHPGLGIHTWDVASPVNGQSLIQYPN